MVLWKLFKLSFERVVLHAEYCLCRIKMNIHEKCGLAMQSTVLLYMIIINIHWMCGLAMQSFTFFLKIICRACVHAVRSLSCVVVH